MKPVEVLHVAHADLQEVVEIAGHQVTVKNEHQISHGLFELSEALRRMLVGFAKDERERRVIGIDACGTPAQTKAQVLDIARRTAGLVALGKAIDEDDVILNDDYAYPCYALKEW